LNAVPSSSPAMSISERTAIIRGADDDVVVNGILQCYLTMLSNVKYKIDVHIDYTRPSLAIEIKQFFP
jgi:hypothetical protein